MTKMIQFSLQGLQRWSLPSLSRSSALSTVGGHSWQCCKPPQGWLVRARGERLTKRGYITSSSANLAAQPGRLTRKRLANWPASNLPGRRMRLTRLCAIIY